MLLYSMYVPVLLLMDQIRLSFYKSFTRCRKYLLCPEGATDIRNVLWDVCCPLGTIEIREAALKRLDGFLVFKCLYSSIVRYTPLLERKSLSDEYSMRLFQKQNSQKSSRFWEFGKPKGWRIDTQLPQSRYLDNERVWNNSTMSEEIIRCAKDILQISSAINRVQFEFLGLMQNIPPFVSIRFTLII